MNECRFRHPSWLAALVLVAWACVGAQGPGTVSAAPPATAPATEPANAPSTAPVSAHDLTISIKNNQHAIAYQLAGKPIAVSDLCAALRAAREDDTALAVRVAAPLDTPYVAIADALVAVAQANIASYILAPAGASPVTLQMPAIDKAPAVDLPGVANPPPPPSATLHLSIATGKTLVDQKALDAFLASPDRARMTVFISSARAVPFADVVSLIARVQKEGVTTIALKYPAK